MQADYDVGDIVFAREDLFNEEEAEIPGLAPNALLAPAGRRGVVVSFGHVEADPRQSIYLVRFEQNDGAMGPPIGCLPDELTQDEALAATLGA
ncbi:MAG: nitrogen fixation protein NifZ [Halothiobacillaceae bacterium]|nr:nitrogen fixation protein NifZ [Halothiobacillaceae bacterium]